MRRIHIELLLLLMVLMFRIDVQAADSFTATAECREGQKVEISVVLQGDDNSVDGFDIYRLNYSTGEYDIVGNIDLYNSRVYDYMDDDDWNYYWNYGQYRVGFLVEEAHVIGVTYTYQVKSYVYGDVDFEKEYIDTVDTTVMIMSDAPVITFGKRVGQSGDRIKWTMDENADGYLIYSVQNYDEKSNYIYVDVYDESQYTLAKTIKKNNTTSKKFTKLMNGVTYTYRICSYKMVDGVMVKSMMSEPKSVTMDYYSHSGESYQERIKRAFGTEKKKTKNFATSTKASKQMKTIKIKVWDFKNGKNGKKVTKVKYLTVNKRLAPSVKAMFAEIYKAKEKQVIKDIGCYSYRTGEHMYGMAIDINANENYMIDDGKILAGSFWNPKKSKYSIPLDCETVRIMERYGFYRGFWGDRKDYMHFSYFGT